MRLNSRGAMLSLAALTLTALVASPRAASAQALTGISLFSTNAAGARAGTDVYNTLGGDGVFNVWLSLGGVAQNGPTDALAAINTALVVPGTYNFTFLTEGGGNFSNYGANFFFNGGAATPLISVTAPLATSGGPTPAFSATGASGLALDGATAVNGSNALTFQSNGNNVTLTAFRFESSVNNPNVVGPFQRTPAQLGPDNVGSFTLTVSAAAPEPSALALVAAGLPAFGLVIRRRKAAK